MVNAQQWLDREYPKEKRSEIREVYLNELGLEGELDLGDFTYYHEDREDKKYGIKVYISFQIDEVKLSFKNLLESTKIIKLVQVQQWLEKNYPKNGTCVRKKYNWKGEEEGSHLDFGKIRSEVTELNVGGENLEGTLDLLDLNDFINLEKLDCFWNRLTSLDLTNCGRLKEVYCSNNQLTNLSLPKDGSSLTKLHCRSNNLPISNLSIFSSFTNLEVLGIGNDDEEKIKQGIYNHFTGSLDYLSGIEELKFLDISNTDIDEVNIDRLPKNLEKIEYSTSERPNCKLNTIVSQLEEHRYGWCQKCKQPNTSEDWCQPCTDKEWQEDLEDLTGQELVEKFIEQQQLRLGKDYEQREKWQWIPYEQFTDIEYLAEGGFSKIYKVKWGKHEWGDDRIVALKSLNNSQNITLEFLREIASTKLVEGSLLIVKCYGISQDPETKNCVIVMEYMKGGNLRQYLKNKTDELSLKDKLNKLNQIISGLRDIHGQNLVHRDFHSGNILLHYEGILSFIADLGLSQPASYKKQKEQIFGVLPYVAPELLQGRPYTQAADIYSFGIIAYELLANAYPYPEMDDIALSLKVCNSYRPDIDKISIPQLLKDLIKKCWDADPNKRLNSGELKEVINSWDKEVKAQGNTLFYYQYQAIKDEYNSWSQSTHYHIHPNAITTSRLINTQEIARLFQESEEQALEQEIKKIKREINQPLTEELKELIKDFIQARKKMLKDENNKEAKDKALALEDQLLDEKGLPEEDIEAIIDYCKRFVEAKQQLEQEQLQTNMEIPSE